MSDIHLISGYKGNSVTGLIGSSVNFSWTFSNGTKGVRGVLFGLIKNHRARDFIPNGILVAFGESGSPASVPVPVQYNGRVSGSYDGNTSTVHAIFTLSSIEKDDERFFGCRVSPQYSWGFWLCILKCCRWVILLAYINNKLSETRFLSPQIDSKIADTFFMLVQDVSTQARREGVRRVRTHPPYRFQRFLFCWSKIKTKWISTIVLF